MAALRKARGLKLAVPPLDIEEILCLGKLMIKSEARTHQKH